MISASDDTLNITAAASRLCPAAVWQFRHTKCQISSEHCLSISTPKYLHKLDLLSGHLALKDSSGWRSSVGLTFQCG